MSAVRAMPEPWKRRLYLPAYRVHEAARYAGVSPQTVAYWHYRGGALGPVLPGRQRRKPLSYLELMEVAVVATFRRLGVSLQKIRKARDYTAQVMNSPFPFAEYQFKTEGQHMLMDLGEADRDSTIAGLVVADAGGQTAWQSEIEDRLRQFDYERDLAIVWHVAGHASPIVIDPRVSFGAPVVRGVPTWALRGRARAGETIQELAEDFQLTREHVVAALAFEGVLEAA